MQIPLLKNLAAAGHKTFWSQTPDGSRILLLPYGARVLGLFSPSNDTNFFWTNPALNQPATAKRLFQSDGWHNTGGDRTWLTPEIDVFFPDYPRCRRHVEQPALDAAEYRLEARDDGVALTRAMTLRFHRAGRTMRLQLSKEIGPAANPLRRETAVKKLMAKIGYAGYTQRTRLRLLGASARAPLPVGIWNLIQLPLGGEMLIPTYVQTGPRLLFGDVPPQALSTEPRCLRFRINLPGEHKIAVRAAASTGRVGYVWKDRRDWSLVVRNFFIDPSGEYVDVPKDEPTDFGYAIHAVNVSSALGDFCEMEYHAPALGCHPRSIEGADVSQVWAFRGPRAAIAGLSERLLGVRPSTNRRGGT
ncbi:MAG: hypothetical protein JXB10_19345 [Pirellulales bacterium]|nr:hypothetical protein [Pirellulales bacterium]